MTGLFRSGLKVITTCSPKYFGMMKDLGADLVYDYVSCSMLRCDMVLTAGACSMTRKSVRRFERPPRAS